MFLFGTNECEHGMDIQRKERRKRKITKGCFRNIIHKCYVELLIVSYM